MAPRKVPAKHQCSYSCEELVLIKRVIADGGSIAWLAKRMKRTEEGLYYLVHSVLGLKGRFPQGAISIAAQARELDVGRVFLLNACKWAQENLNKGRSVGEVCDYAPHLAAVPRRLRVKNHRRHARRGGRSQWVWKDESQEAVEAYGKMLQKTATVSEYAVEHEVNPGEFWRYLAARGLPTAGRHRRSLLKKWYGLFCKASTVSNAARAAGVPTRALSKALAATGVDRGRSRRDPEELALALRWLRPAGP